MPRPHPSLRLRLCSSLSSGHPSPTFRPIHYTPRPAGTHTRTIQAVEISPTTAAAAATVVTATSPTSPRSIYTQPWFRYWSSGDAKEEEEGDVKEKGGQNEKDKDGRVRGGRGGQEEDVGHRRGRWLGGMDERMVGRGMHVAVMRWSGAGRGAGRRGAIAEGMCG